MAWVVHVWNCRQISLLIPAISRNSHSCQKASNGYNALDNGVHSCNQSQCCAIDNFLIGRVCFVITLVISLFEETLKRHLLTLLIIIKLIRITGTWLYCFSHTYINNWCYIFFILVISSREWRDLLSLLPVNDVITCHLFQGLRWLLVISSRIMTWSLVISSREWRDLMSFFPGNEVICCHFFQGMTWSFIISSRKWRDLS